MKYKIKKTLALNILIMFIMSFILSVNSYAEVQIYNTGELQGGAIVKDGDRAFSQGEIVNFDNNSIQWPAASYPVGTSLPGGLPYLVAGNTVEIITPMPYMVACTNEFADALKPRIMKSSKYSGNTDIQWSPVSSNYDEHIYIFKGTVNSVDAGNPNYIVQISFDFDGYFTYHYAADGATYSAGMDIWMKKTEIPNAASAERVLNLTTSNGGVPNGGVPSGGGTSSTAPTPTPTPIPTPPKIEIPKRIVFVGDAVLTKANIIPDDGTVVIKNWTADQPRYVKTENSDTRNATNLRGSRVGVSQVIATTQQEYLDTATGTMKSARGENTAGIIDAAMDSSLLSMIPNRSKNLQVQITRPNITLNAEAFGIEITANDGTNISDYVTYQITNRGQEGFNLKLTAKSEVHETPIPLTVRVTYRNDDGAITKKDLSLSIRIVFKIDTT